MVALRNYRQSPKIVRDVPHWSETIPHPKRLAVPLYLHGLDVRKTPIASPGKETLKCSAAVAFSAFGLWQGRHVRNHQIRAALLIIKNDSDCRSRRAKGKTQYIGTVSETVRPYFAAVR